jgi:16S rRNA (guanine(966)-N(2))-methyltransferase RsmD
MRIIGGALKGRNIPPAHLLARPTTDFAKEGLFNILTNEYDFDTISVLDLFGGSGSISFEFASRGCKSITCVEMNPLHTSFIKKTALQLKLNAIRVVHHNVFDFITICTQTYDLIFADPPFHLHNLETLPNKIRSAGLLNSNGIFILEHPSSFDFTPTDGFRRMRKYGSVHFSFFSFDPLG